MHDDQTPLVINPTSPAPISPPPQPPASNSPVAPKGVISRNTYEYIMLVFGILTIISLLVNNGFFMKLSAGVFLIVAIITIVKNMLETKQTMNSGPVAQSAATAPKRKSHWKLITIALLLIIALPLLPYLGFIVIIVIFIIYGAFGGNADMGC